MASRRALRLASTATAVVGIGLFVWSIRLAGGTAVLDGVRRLGSGFAIERQKAFYWSIMMIGTILLIGAALHIFGSR